MRGKSKLTIEQKNLIHKYSNGNPANFEQYINLTADKLRAGIPFSVPQKQRINKRNQNDAGRIGKNERKRKQRKKDSIEE